MNFKSVIQWIKQNPVAVAAAGLCVAAIIFLLIVNVQGNSFLEETAKRANEIKRIDGFRTTSMRLPPEKVDAGQRHINAVVNQPAIDYLERLFSQMQGDYNQIWDLAVKHNQGDEARGRHLPMTEGLFPDSTNQEFKLYDARRDYLLVFDDMLRPATGSSQYPRLNAGGPVPAAQITQATESFDRNMRIRLNIPENEQLSETQQAQLAADKRRVAMDVIRHHAQSIHIYAGKNAFQIDTWETRPSLTSVWESQLNLWIQQDIVQTISRTNRVSNPAFNVIAAPIKRLNSIRVVPGYVGINSGGGMSSRSGYGSVTSGEAVLKDDFTFAPTGRMSNSLYDVKHVWVDMDVDVQQLPVFMDELVQTNFMSVLKMEMVDVDEYAMLQQGYFFGSADVVNVKMLIETIWLRDWLVPLMPTATKELLGIVPPAGGQ